MDAEFVQSVARVGDYIEVSLVTGDRFRGMLAELTLSRLALRAPDGCATAVALTSIATVMQLPLAEPSPAPAQTLTASAAESAAPVLQAPANAVGTINTPATSVPPTLLPDNTAPEGAPVPGAGAKASPEQLSDINQEQDNGQQDNGQQDNGQQDNGQQDNGQQDNGQQDNGQQDNGYKSSSSYKEALTLVAMLKTAPVDTDIYVLPEDRNRLQQIRDSYRYAEKVNELEPRFGRIGILYQRTLHLWNSDQKNAELTRLVGALSLQGGMVENAHVRFVQAADLGDVPALRLLAVTAAKLGDSDTVLYGLLRYFRSVAPDSDPAAWEALLAVLDARGGRSQLGELLDSASLDDVAHETVRKALGRATPNKTPMSRPPGAISQPPPAIRPLLTTMGLSVPRPLPRAKHPDAGRTTTFLRSPALRGQNPYQVAKYLEHRIKDLQGAQEAYRQAIKKGIKRQSAVKDLAWLTKRLEGSEAALKVIENEFPGMIMPGNALDNILIDFLPGARRYDEALKILKRQHGRADITSSRRYHLAYQIAYVKLAGGLDSTADWRKLLAESPDNSAAQGGLAMALIQQVRWTASMRLNG